MFSSPKKDSQSNDHSYTCIGPPNEPDIEGSSASLAPLPSSSTMSTTDLSQDDIEGSSASLAPLTTDSSSLLGEGENKNEEYNKIKAGSGVNVIICNDQSEQVSWCHTVLSS